MSKKMLDCDVRMALLTTYIEEAYREYDETLRRVILDLVEEPRNELATEEQVNQIHKELMMGNQYMEMGEEIDMVIEEYATE